ncbi:MAG: glycogen-binding domain-containing protein [Elusimicrobiota bacterium]
MLKKCLLVAGLVCLWNVLILSGLLESAGLGARVKKEETTETKKDGPVETKNGVKFTYKGSAENVFLAGSFNDWSATKNPLKQIKQDVWETVLPLDVGKYQYKFVVDGNWLTDPENPETTDDGLGGKNSVVEVKSGVEKIVSKAKGGPVETKAGVKFVYKGTAENVFLAGSFNDWSTTKNLLKQVKQDVWEIVLPLDAGKYQYKFVVDGNWTPDAENPNTADDGYGGQNAIVEVTKSAEKIVPTGKDKSSAPFPVKDGYKFTFYAPTADAVCLAGSFNNWADSKDGVIENPQYLMKKNPQGIWVKIVPLSSGQYQYKYCVDGKPDGWTADPHNNKNLDKDGNSILIVK